MLIWQKSDAVAICRVGIAGDFLPTGGLTLPEGAHWFGMTQAVARYFHDLDIAIVNLESPVNVGGLPPRRKLALGENLSAPAESLDYLVGLRATLLGLANNHIYDYGEAGLEATKQAIRSRGMTAIGGRCTLKDTPDVFVWEGPAQLRVGFWAAARGLRECAAQNAAGVESATLDRACKALELMKRLDAQACIALLHAGLERTNRPDPEDVRIMDSFARSGFDFVAACHSHRVSGHKVIARQKLHPAFCFYGLGSLCSGIMYSPLEREGILVAIGLTRQGAVASVEVRPILLTGSGWGTAPTPLEGEGILQRFQRSSEEIENGSYERLFYRDISKGLLSGQLLDARMAFRQGGIKGITAKLGRLRIRHMRRLVHKVLG